MNVSPVRTLPARLVARGVDVAPGVGVTVAIALVATGVARLVPALGSALPALLIGVVVAVIRKPAGRDRKSVV